MFGIGQRSCPVAQVGAGFCLKIKPADADDSHRMPPCAYLRLCCAFGRLWVPFGCLRTVVGRTKSFRERVELAAFKTC